MIAGVEENSQSRFIDYTFATPWESLVSELERTIKGWIAPETIIIHPDEMDHSDHILNNPDDQQGEGTPSDIDINSEKVLTHDPVNEGDDDAVKPNGKAEYIPPIAPKRKEIKIDNKVTINYLDAKYVFSYCKSDTADDESSKEKFYRQIRSWFNISNFLSFTGDAKRYNASPSQRQTLLSALCAAMHNCGCVNIPVFFVPQDITRSEVYTISDIRGYEIRVQNIAHDSFLADTTPPSAVTSVDTNSNQLRSCVIYETSVTEGVDSTNELFYLDGLVKHFDNKLNSFSVGNLVGSNVRNMVCEMKEIFHYNHDGSSLSQRTQPPRVSSEVTAAILATQQQQQQQHQLMVRHENRAENGTEHENDNNKYSHLNYLTQLWCLFPDYLQHSAATSELEITIRYPSLKHGTFMDNERYTTFQPSKQEAGYWSVRTAFKPIFKVATKRIAIDNNIYSTSATLGSCLRRLLAFFVYSYSCCPSDVAMMSLLKLNKAGSEARIKGVDLASNIVGNANLSSKTRTVIDEMFSKINRVSRAPDATKYMSLLFSHHNRRPPACTHNSNTRTSNGIPSGPGSLLEVISVAIGSLAVDMQSIGEMWSDCVAEMRRHWEIDMPLPAMWSPILLSAIHEDAFDVYETNPFTASAAPTECVNSGSDSAAAQSAWTKHLWNDLLLQKNIVENTFVTIPDTSQSIIIQKLQYLNFCGIMKRENPYRFLSTIKPLYEVDSEDMFAQGTSTTAALSALSSGTTGANTISLLRRVPLTGDGIAQRKHLEAKFTSGKSQSVADNPLLRWQITHPALVSDIRAYKHKYLSNTLDDFLRWYLPISELHRDSSDNNNYTSSSCSSNSSNIDSMSVNSANPAAVAAGGYDVPADVWPMLWSLCDPCHSSNQRVMFRVETEAEKSIAYLEDVSARELSLQFLLLSMTSLYAMLRNELRPWRCVPSSATSATSASTTTAASTSNRTRVLSADSDDIVDEDDIFYNVNPSDMNNILHQSDIDITSYIRISKELAQLRNHIISFEALIQTFSSSLTTSITSTNPNVKSNPTNAQIIEVVMLIEKIIDAVESLEEKIVQFHEIGTVLMMPTNGSGSRFVTNLCREREISAKTDNDVKSLFDLVKFVSRGTESHSWNSEDGRELGKPTKKIFHLTCQTNCRLVDNLSIANDDSPLLSDLEHAMTAQTLNGKLFVATKFCEFDS